MDADPSESSERAIHDVEAPRVIIVAEDGAAGGIGRYSVDLASELGSQAHVACLCDAPCSADEACWLAIHCATKGVPLHRISMPAKGWRSGLGGLARLWRRTGRPMIHVNGRRGNSIALAMRLGVPGFRYVTTVHGILGLHSRRNAIYRIVDQAAGRFAKTVIAVSEHGRRVLVQTGSPSRNTVAITNGLAAADLRELRDVAAGRRSAPAVRSVVRIGFLGRLSPEKGTRELLDVARRLAGDDVGVTIHIAGDGPDRDWMTSASEAMTDAGFITWHGAITDVVAFLRDVDVLVVPSHNEGLPYALLEAMAAGCAVVAFAVGGIPEAIGDSTSGVLIPAGDVQGLTAAVARLAADPMTISDLGASASTRVELHFALAARLPAIRRAYGIATDSSVAARDVSGYIRSE